jgi:hypothetical protein
VHGDKKSSVRGRLHAETILTQDRKRKVKLVHNKAILFICEVPTAPAVAGIREWTTEREGLKTKIGRSPHEEERLQELVESIGREEKRQAMEQVNLTVQAIRNSMEVSLINSL